MIFVEVSTRRVLLDSTEGTKTHEGRVTQLIATGDADEKEAFRKLTNMRVGGTITAPPGFKMQHNQDSSDIFLLCFSSELSATVQREFEETNACVEISDSDGFLKELTATLDLIVGVKFAGLYPISYTERVESRGLTQFSQMNDPGLNPALIKEPHFRNQKEVRACWAPLGTEPIQPMIVGSRRLIKFCRDVTCEL